MASGRDILPVMPSAKEEIGSMAASRVRGIYRTHTPASGARYAAVDYGDAARLETLTESYYRSQEYTPPFDELPTKDQYERQQSAKPTGDDNAKGA